MSTTKSKTTFHVERLNQGKSDELQIIWAHGWGHSHINLLPLAEPLKNFGIHYLVDHPGFGKSATPPSSWGTEDYADVYAEWISTLPDTPKVWIGHSFGCRVGIQVAARHPELLDALVLISAAGIKPHKSLWQRALLSFKIYSYKLIKIILKKTNYFSRFSAMLGSNDFNNSGQMKSVFIRAVNENLSCSAKKIKIPSLLIYGSEDRDTPLDIGEKFNTLIKSSELIILHGDDHHTVLDESRHQTVHLISKFIKKNF